MGHRHAITLQVVIPLPRDVVVITEPMLACVVDEELQLTDRELLQLDRRGLRGR
jgi:hypothetical protein